MWVMEENKKWSVVAFDSLKDELSGRSGNYGELSLHFNAAIAMFLLADDGVREHWIGLIERAKRTKDDRTILERVKAFAQTPPASTSAADEEIRKRMLSVVAKDRDAAKSRRKGRGPAPGQSEDRAA